MWRLLFATVLVVSLLAGAGSAIASSDQPLYRTRHQAELYLEYELQSWGGDDLGKPLLRAAFCISGSAARPKANRQYAQRRVNRWGDRVYRTFACTLSAEVKGPSQLVGHSQVYGLYLATTPTGWHVTALH